ncbi:transcription regulator [Thamnocephalis sphaerospora]|uniref:Transcription regulator n=1 Tax=Thamnocephalis sphaerospora TaxID=78915 RepID=A0A4P9XNF7_9FUNG|nr:transcription regulator [Thamnocephalis sphaerospora]|eukprot:RKP07507.1 transcription regulator [Thamnocephalis sphaerospora]
MSSDNDKSKRPANTAFKQQRLKAWQPILTPKTVLPTFFIIGILFAPIGGVLFYVSESVSEISIDYTKCESAGEAFSSIPSDHFTYSFPSASRLQYMVPQYKKANVTIDDSNRLPGAKNDAVSSATRCTISMEIPVDMKPPVYLYYRLDGFYQNHRKYVKSFDAAQLKGTARTYSELYNGGCSDLAGPGGDSQQVYYPCGLIANSIFNDTISLSLVKSNDTPNAANPAETLTFNDRGIAWPSDKKKYGPSSYQDYTNVLPPPNWASRYANGVYTKETFPNLAEDEHFQVWMRTAGLPNFRKLYGRSDNTMLKRGNYTLEIDMHFPSIFFGGQKAIVLSTVSFLGGKNPFLGIAYICVAVVCVILGCVFTLRHLYRPRKLGDHTYLSWNQQGGPAGPESPRSPGASAQ